jgi:hypothetical protein
MGDFMTITTPKARKARPCPECGATIKAGERYARIAGSSDGDFFAAVQCLPCQAFAERFMASLDLSSALNWDEKTYQFGGMLDEAAEHLGAFRAEDRDEQAWPQRRDAMMAMFDEADEAERAYQKRERELRRAARERAATLPVPPQRYVATGRRP